MAFHHQEIEKKWQDRWEKSGIFYAKDDSTLPKYYCLIEFPYPSGAGLHIGHPRSYTALDVIARKRRMEGYNVLYPIGWDAFGLPTENYAIKTGRKPQDVTRENIATFKRQLKSFGLSFDWSREINTTDPEYYKWTQWMFLEFLKAGLAYKATMPINWCTSCKIGLANEEVVGGMCERCGGVTEKRQKQQWMIAITKYADRLLEDLKDVDYLEKIKTQQRNWIGKSEGAEIVFSLLVDGQPDAKHVQRVFTTRPDTLFGATFLVVSPEVAQSWLDVGWQASEEVKTYVATALKRDETERTDVDREKTGVDTGVFALHPIHGKKMPVWVADYVLGQYGTGAIMAVPAHDERDFAFAKKYGLPILRVVEGGQADTCFSGEGEVVASDFLNGMQTAEAKNTMISWLVEHGCGNAKTTYKLRDWVFSRQRYWGEPIPLVYCAACATQDTSVNAGWIPLPDDQLPVRLPDVEKYEPTDTGESPLAAMHEWVNTVCPRCQGPATRETDTMPNWAGSSWYFLAYVMNQTHQFQFPMKPYQEVLKKWMPVDWYNGGMEHTTLHLLYSRFWNKVLYDRGHVPTNEPYAKRTSHGLIMADDGTKMSKSKGNVVNPDEMIQQYGADAVRLYELFMGPFAEPVPWQINGLVGMRRFLEKTTNLAALISQEESEHATRALHQMIKKVSDDIEGMRFNTAVSALMVYVNTIKDQGAITQDSCATFLRMLCPFAPHLANELFEQIGGTHMLETLSWPTSDPALSQSDVVEIAVQINGKTRGMIEIPPDADEQTALMHARENVTVAKYLEEQEIRKVVYVQGKILNLVITPV